MPHTPTTEGGLLAAGELVRKQREEFFRVNLIFPNTQLLDVEISQSAIDFWRAEGTAIIEFKEPIPPGIPEEPELEQPEDEEPRSPIEPTIPGDAVTLVIPNATYGPSPTPGLARVMLKIVSRLKDKTALIKDPWLFIQVKDDITKTDVKLETFQLKPQGIVFQQDFVFDVDTPSKRISILVTMFEAASFPISRGRRITLTFNAGTTPAPDPGEPSPAGSNFFPFVVLATAGAAFISEGHFKKKRRR